jgi:hypothetical protein
MKLRPAISAAAGAVLALAGLQAQAADTVVITGFAYQPVRFVQTALSGNPAFSRDIEAGVLDGTLNGASIVTYCAQLDADLTLGTAFTDFTQVSGVAAWGAPVATELGKLFTWANATGYVTDNNTSAAFQSAIWEALYETGGSHGFTTGSFTVVPGPNAFHVTQAALDGINWAAIDATTSAYTVTELSSPSTQDLLIATPVPEPGTYASMLAGLVGIGFVARRRSTQR